MTITLRPHQQRGLDALHQNAIGQVIVPTGGGKTLIAIMDAVRRFSIKVPRTIVVVALVFFLQNNFAVSTWAHQQLTNVLHVHSGETKHFRTTKSEQIKLFVEMCQTVREHVIIFTTYHSLHRVQESGIPVDTIYFDEHITVSNVTSSVPQSISRNTQIVVTISLDSQDFGHYC